jgi:uncharacterized membrane protein YsdA (DUF1294 family)
MGLTPWWVVPWYVVASLLTFIAYGWDKVSAKSGHWRTQESTLHTLEMLGGWPGAWLAQPLWRHKSRKASFRAAFKVAAAVNVAGLIAFVDQPNIRFITGPILRTPAIATAEATPPIIAPATPQDMMS